MSTDDASFANTLAVREPLFVDRMPMRAGRMLDPKSPRIRPPDAVAVAAAAEVTNRALSCYRFHDGRRVLVRT